MLSDHGIVVDRTVTKIDDDGEKILEDAFKDRIIANAPKKAIVAPKTKKSSDDESITISDIEKVEKEIKEEKKSTPIENEIEKDKLKNEDFYISKIVI